MAAFLHRVPHTPEIAGAVCHCVFSRLSYEADAVSFLYRHGHQLTWQLFPPVSRRDATGNIPRIFVPFNGNGRSQGEKGKPKHKLYATFLVSR